jgi:hypothetical protein
VADERQALAIEELLRAEWREYVAENDAEIATDPRDRAEALRRASDAQKQVLLWTRELTAATPPVVAAPAAPSLTDLHAARTRNAAAKRQRLPINKALIHGP